MFKLKQKIKKLKDRRNTLMKFKGLWLKVEKTHIKEHKKVG